MVEMNSTQNLECVKQLMLFVCINEFQQLQTIPALDIDSDVLLKALLAADNTCKVEYRSRDLPRATDFERAIESGREQAEKYERLCVTLVGRFFVDEQGDVFFGLRDCSPKKSKRGWVNISRLMTPKAFKRPVLWILHGLMHSHVSRLNGVRCSNEQFIISWNSGNSDRKGSALSPTILALDRSVRRSLDMPGTKSIRAIIEEAIAALKATSESAHLHMVEGDAIDTFSLGSAFPLGVGLFEHYDYLIHNIYNCSEGSREDGINDLIWLKQYGTKALSAVADERLRHLSIVEPSPQVRMQLESLNSESASIVPSDLLQFSAEEKSIPVFQEIAAGSFIMGTNDPSLYISEQGAHTIHLDRYFIARDPISVDLYMQYICDSRSFVDVPPNWKSIEWVIEHRNHPVSAVTWYSAVRYAEWLHKKMVSTRTIEPGWKVALPSESQWEKAGRGETGLKHPWGNEMDYMKCNIKASGIGTTSEIGSYSPQGDSVYGVRDLVGNVREWTSSLWGAAAHASSFSYPYSSDDGREDLAAPSNIRRVIRGGGYYYDDKCANCIVRNRAHPNNFHNGGGFRVVITKDKNA